MRSGLAFAATRHSRCDDCGLNVEPGDPIASAFRQGRGHGPPLQPLLYVHELCPVGDVLFRQIEWLREWRGADIISAWGLAKGNTRCSDCEKFVRAGEPIALVRRPGPLKTDGVKHSDWKCRECVKL